MMIALMTNNYKPFIGGVPISVERLAIGLRSLGQFDMIHVHHPMLIGKTAIYLSRKYSVPLAFTYHTRYEQYLGYFKGYRFLEEGAGRNKGVVSALEQKFLYGIREKYLPAYLLRFMRNCHHIFVPTAGMKQYLIDKFHFEEPQIDILPTGLSEDGDYVTRQEIGALRIQYKAEQIPLLLSVSRMAGEKNIIFLLHSISRLKLRRRLPVLRRLWRFLPPVFPTWWLTG